MLNIKTYYEAKLIKLVELDENITRHFTRGYPNCQPITTYNFISHHGESN
jgi:hypothetical protein